VRRSLTRGTLPWMMLALGTAAACGSVTEARPLQDFQWIAVDNPNDVHEGIDAAVFAGDIDLLGQISTPTLCFNLAADYGRSGSDLTVHVTAKSTNSSNCTKTPGGFQYTALLRGLGRGSYTLHVIHTVSGGAETSYSKALEIQ